MTRLQILQSVSRLIEDSKHQRIKAKDILLEISNGEREIAIKTKCLRAFDTSKSTIESQADYALPDRCIHLFAIKIDNRPIVPTTREWMDDYELKNFSDETNWETKEGEVIRWIYQPETTKELKLVYIPNSDEAGKVIRMHYAYIPETVLTPKTAIFVPSYAEEGVRLFALFKCQRQLETMYKDQHSLAQASIWQRKSIINIQQYERELMKIREVLEGFQGRTILERDGTAGLIFSADDY